MMLKTWLSELKPMSATFWRSAWYFDHHLSINDQAIINTIA